ncbi:hypothetical protein PQR64_37920, partial [Paraburkholderia phytofirmans]|uniref:hypothetical protein n=1 Tax=Paraburkholderia phytofirmans TaxID=261302 RepID=UPI0038B85961
MNGLTSGADVGSTPGNRHQRPEGRLAASGREYSLATGGFREADFQWLLSGDEFEERIDATRPSLCENALI